MLISVQFKYEHHKTYIPPIVFPPFVYMQSILARVLKGIKGYTHLQIIRNKIGKETAGSQVLKPPKQVVNPKTSALHDVFERIKNKIK